MVSTSDHGSQTLAAVQAKIHFVESNSCFKYVLEKRLSFEPPQARVCQRNVYIIGSNI